MTEQLHSTTMDAGSLFDAAEKAAQPWSRMWWFPGVLRCRRVHPRARQRGSPLNLPHSPKLLIQRALKFLAHIGNENALGSADPPPGWFVGDSDERSCKDSFVRLAEDPSGTGRPPVANVSPRVCGYSRTRRAHKSAVVKPTSKYGHITTRSPTLVTALIPPSWDRMNATDGSIFSTKRNAERWRVP